MYNSTELNENLKVMKKWNQAHLYFLEVTTAKKSVQLLISNNAVMQAMDNYNQTPICPIT